MSDKFKDIYRIESARLQNWDYGWIAPYFVTICTVNRECYFGEIVETPFMAYPKMILSDIGKIAEKELMKTPELRPDMNINLGAFCIMPNHFHGIIIIGKNEYNRRDAMLRVSKTKTQNVDVIGNVINGGIINRDAMHGVSTAAGKQNRFEPQRKNLTSIVRGFKSSVTMYARKNKIDFAWQMRFHDHIIRDDESFHKIKQYIENNVANWQYDQFYLI